MLVGQHGQKAVDLGGREMLKEAVQLVVRVLGGVEQAAVQLDVERAAVFLCKIPRPLWQTRQRAYRWSNRLQVAAHGRP